MVLSKLAFLLGIASLAAGRVVKREDPPFQHVPATAQPDNTFHVGKEQKGMPLDTVEVPDAMYGARSIDLPFGRLQHGKMKFFDAGQLNTPTENTDVWAPGVHDSAKQSACGIPDSAFQISKVAIHPYWLKFAPLERYCMQDVCISFWNEETALEKQSDMILKITDVCSTDPNDPTACLTPYDIKIDRAKASIMHKLNLKGMPPIEEQAALNGTEFTDGKTWWFFMKCWADALPQPAYQSPNNWFTTPPLPNNLKWAQKAQTDQVNNNQISYAAKGWQVYPNGAYRMDRGPATAPLLIDWKRGMPDPEWCPVAGGKGWGIPTGKDCSSGAPQMTAQSNDTSLSTNANSTQDYGQGPSLPPITNTTTALSDAPNSPNTSGDSTQVDDQGTPALSDDSNSPSTSNNSAQAYGEDSSSPSITNTTTSDVSDEQPTIPSPVTTPTSSASAPVSSPSSSGGASSEDGACPAEDDACPGEEDEEVDETCAADEVESEETKPEAEQPEVQLERPGAAEEKPEAGGQYAEEEEGTCAADEVWED
ncbi:MAG: hypothetical protein Q9172_001544 [Xanthocarpia lactea]